MMSGKLTEDELRAYHDFLAHGGTPVICPASPMIEEPEWMYDLEEVVGAPILDDIDQPCDIKPAAALDHARPYKPRHKSEQEWRDTWR